MTKINHLKQKLLVWCNKPMTSGPLGLFRALFGIIVILEVGYYYQIDFIGNFLLAPKMLFSYEFLPVSVLPESAMKLLLLGLGLSGLLITFGLYFRWATAYFFIVFSYFFFLDKCNYNNHLYLFSLVSLLLCFTNADSSFSLGKANSRATVPQWQIRILQFQIGIVVFFGGVAKLNPFWFDLHPVIEFLADKSAATGFDFLNSKPAQYFIMLGGLVFDLSAIFLLLFKRTRVLGIVAAFLFNITNAWLFDDIYTFPLFMIFTLVLFLDEDEFRKLPLPRLRFNKKVPESTPHYLKTIWLSFILAFVVIQVVLPLRHYAYPGYTDWTGEGQLLAWRMKIQHRVFDRITFRIIDKETGLSKQVLPENHITIQQYKKLATAPQMLVLFAEYIERLALEKNPASKYGVSCNSKVKFNGSDYAFIVDPNLDILEASRTHGSYNDWIEPMPKPLEK